MHHPVTTIQQLATLKQETLVYAVVVMIVALLVSFIIATLIPYKGGKDNSYIARRVVAILCCVFSALGYWIYNQTVVMGTIKNVGFKSQFATTNLLTLLITVLGFVLVGLLVAIVFKKSKFATIFFKHKK